VFYVKYKYLKNAMSLKQKGIFGSVMDPDPVRSESFAGSGTVYIVVISGTKCEFGD
jgi:hypothetical protein